MTALFYCNTLFQLISAMQISKKQEFDSYILVLSSKIPGYKELSVRIKEHNSAFKIVVPLSFDEKKSIFTKLARCIFGFADENLSNEHIDAIIAFNMDYETHCLFSFFSKKNKNLIAMQMEEGVLSYNTTISHSRLIRFSNAMRHLLFKPVLLRTIKKFYAFSPDLYKGDLRVDYIPKIDQANKDEILMYGNVFGKKSDYLVKEKFIYIPSVYDFEGNKPIGELKLATKLANHFGIKNILVKPHPRDKIERFKNLEFSVNTDTIPIELFWLFYCSKENIIITTLSSAVLNIKNMFLDTPNMYYIYKLCDYSKNCLANFYASCIQRYINLRLFPKVFIVDSMEDLNE